MVFLPRTSPLLSSWKEAIPVIKVPTYFIFSRAFYLFRVIGDAFDIAMTRMKMAQCHYVRLRFTQAVAQVRMTWVCYDGFFFPSNQKAGMS